MRSIERSFYKSKAWERTRELYLKKVNHLCERCLENGLVVPARIVHHKIYLTEANYRDPNVSLSFENLEALCQDCHNSEHFGDKKKIKRWEFVDGELQTAPMVKIDA